jgi:hypothetical protein
MSMTLIRGAFPDTLASPVLPSILTVPSPLPQNYHRPSHQILTFYHDHYSMLNTIQFHLLLMGVIQKYQIYLVEQLQRLVW